MELDTEKLIIAKHYGSYVKIIILLKLCIYTARKQQQYKKEISKWTWLSLVWKL